MNPILAFQNWYINASPDKKKKALLVAVGSIATLAVLLTTGSNESNGSVIDSNPLFFLGVAAKLGAVLLLIAGGAIILRRWYGNRIRGGTDRRLHLVETVRLSPKQALHVVEVAGRHYLIGATDQSISMLSSLELKQSEIGIRQESLPEDNFGEILTSMKQNPIQTQPVNRS